MIKENETMTNGDIGGTVNYFISKGETLRDEAIGYAVITCVKWLVRVLRVNRRPTPKRASATVNPVAA